MDRSTVILSAILLVTSACVLCGRGTPERVEEMWRCPPLPETFQESDLVGVWQAEYVPGFDTDTLILGEDGTYTQVFVCDKCEPEGYSVESSGEWWLEHRTSGGFYLHLEGMHRCDVTDEICRQEGGGGGDGGYWDFCESRVVEMPNEVVLMVTGVPERGTRVPAPRGIWLWHMAFERGGGGGSHFILIEHPSPPVPSFTPTTPSTA